MSDVLSPTTTAVQRVTDHLRALNHPHPPRMLEDAARTAQQVADALGVALGQIAKSIVFRRKSDGVAVILLVAGVGVGALLLASATAFTVVKFAGAGYLIWLGLKQWR